MSHEQLADGPTGGAAFTDLHARARRTGQWAWLERRLFEIVGGWAGTTEDPASSVLFGEMSRRHGWHAEVFFDRLPELASVDAEQLVTSPGPATDALLAAVAAQPPVIGRLVATYRVLLPLLVTEYRSTLVTLSPVAEPSLRRWLDIVVRDDLEEWARGHEVLSGALVTAEDVRDAGDRQVALDLLVLATDHLTC